ncbi:MAG: Lipoprotein [uncultured Aureispira sp.]|uniref:Lipoprotein n=1 Tax=uncultured Aureispira sp. TaxID=1331704 RepID=A0A6S6SGX7_9BACT|nr:MAG: Lipoprotein [uncultured Aureispira sp.]
MEGYFNLKVKFVIAVLLAVLAYVSYLYVFKKQRPTSFSLSIDCTKKQVKEGTTKADLFFERYFEERVLRDPEWQGRLGRKEQQGEWTLRTEAFAKKEHLYNQKMLRYLEDSILLSACLEEPARWSARLLKRQLKVALEGYQYRHYTYPVNLVKGAHASIVSVLIKEHEIADRKDAEAYIARVEKVGEKIDALIVQLELRSKKNFILPKFLFRGVFISIQEIMENKADEPNLVLLNFNQKIEKLSIDAAEKEVLKERLIQAFDEAFVPSYQRLYKYLVALEKKATDEVGVWRWEAGTEFYAFKLKEQTTTPLTAEEVYNLGEEEVSRIQDELRTILKTLNYEGDLHSFFKFLQNDPQFYYPNTKRGKQAYIDREEAILDSIQNKLDRFFITKPKKELIIKPLVFSKPKTTLKTIPPASLLGDNKPSIYYVNTDDMKQLPKYIMDVLLYDEAIPGHYLQEGIEASLVHLPKFRRLENTSRAYVDGWGMYAAFLSKEMGAYQEAYADIGRLTAELWRACHLVVDVGLHQKKWTKEAAIAYYQQNTPNPATECLKMVERQLVLPAESIRYKIGMITILELRKRAELELGAAFDLREFHEVLLTNGQVSLDILQDLVEEYIQTKKE